LSDDLFATMLRACEQKRKERANEDDDRSST
jgi:hypothetical protein